MSRSDQFAALIDDLIKQSQNTSASTARSVGDLLDSVRRDIVARIAAARSGSFTSWQLQNLLAEIDRALKEFALIAGREVNQKQQTEFHAGEALVDKPLASIGSGATLVGLPRENLVIAQGYSADLITGISRELRSKISAELRRTMLGGRPITDAIANVDKLLGGAADRAEGIVMNELATAQSAATFARLQQTDSRFPPGEVKKKWKHLGIGAPRVWHITLDGPAIPVNEYFTSEETGAQMRFPRDPAMLNASDAIKAKESINCHCRLVPDIAIPERNLVPRHGHFQQAA